MLCASRLGVRTLGWDTVTTTVALIPTKLGLGSYTCSGATTRTRGSPRVPETQGLLAAQDGHAHVSPQNGVGVWVPQEGHSRGSCDLAPGGEGHCCTS